MDGNRPLAIVTGASSALSSLMPHALLAEQHRKMAEPGSAPH